MKNRFTNFSALLLFCAMVASLPVQSQSIVYDHPFPGQETEYTIIRNYTPEVDIQYVVYGNHQPYSFDYVDRSTQTVRSFFMPVSYNVSDFVVHDGYVYFCGYYPASTKDVSSRSPSGLFGWFNIDSVYFYGGNVYYCEIPTNIHFVHPQTHIIYNNHIYGFNHIAVDTVAGIAHIFLTGQSAFDNNSTSVIVDAWHDPSVWHLDYTMDYFQKNEYRDVAVTENYVVVLAYTLYNASTFEHCLVTYPRHTASTATQSIFDNISPVQPITAPRYVTDHAIFSPASYEMTLVEMGSDSLATMCIDANNDPAPYVISFYSDPSLPPFTRISFSKGSSLWWGAYNPLKESLCVIRGAADICLYRITAPFNNVVKVATSEPLLWTSIDWVRGTNYFVLPGTTLDFIDGQLWLYDQKKETECIYKENVDVELLELDHTAENMIQVHHTRPISPIWFIPTITKTTLNIICSE